MKTAFQTGPGFFAADTKKVDKSIPGDVMRIYCARLEAYDIPLADSSADHIQFTVLFGMCDNDPRLARALLKLGETIEMNKAMLTEVAAKS